jgi:hypothetical protein
MKTVVFQYPGDPILLAVLQTGREFLAHQPRPREVVLRTSDREERWDLGDDMNCDQCNAEIGLDDAVSLVQSRLYCPACTAKWITPYLKEAASS